MAYKKLIESKLGFLSIKKTCGTITITSHFLAYQNYDVVITKVDAVSEIRKLCFRTNHSAWMFKKTTKIFCYIYGFESF